MYKRLFLYSKAKYSASLMYGQISPSNYVVNVGLGSPQKELTFIMHTSSTLLLTRREPCLGGCHIKQKHPIFDPSKSSTHANISNLL